jgi:predicted enzyme related to lactoylglutathione lyase
VLYLLGYINESLAKPAEAKAFYERVFGVDIQFRDVGDRLNAVDKALAS